MKVGMLGIVTVAIVVIGVPAFAHTTRKPDNGFCTSDGNPCNVYCDNGQLAGVMYWNGSVWTDGVKSDANMDAEAQKICAANGVACK
jgi:hypothetical protein